MKLLFLVLLSIATYGSRSHPTSPLLLGDFHCIHDASSSKGVKIDLSDNDLCNRTPVKALATFLRNNPCITEIKLRGNFLEAKDIAALLKLAGPRADAILIGGQRAGAMGLTLVRFSARRYTLSAWDTLGGVRLLVKCSKTAQVELTSGRV